MSRKYLCNRSGTESGISLLRYELVDRKASDGLVRNLYNEAEIYLLSTIGGSL